MKIRQYQYHGMIRLPKTLLVFSTRDSDLSLHVLIILSSGFVVRRRSRGLDGLLDEWGGEGPVLCNYNSIHKMEPQSFTVFMNIMRRYVSGTSSSVRLQQRNLELCERAEGNKRIRRLAEQQESEAAVKTFS